MVNLKKAGAIGVLLTMLSGLAMELRTQVYANESNIIRLLEREKTTKELLIEIKDDIKYIKRNIPREKK
jgi:hypothetical protein